MLLSMLNVEKLSILSTKKLLSKVKKKRMWSFFLSVLMLTIFRLLILGYFNKLVLWNIYMHVMVDPGASLNLVSSRLVKDSKLPTMKSNLSRFAPINCATMSLLTLCFSFLMVSLQSYAMLVNSTCVVFSHDVIYRPTINYILVEHRHGISIIPSLPQSHYHIDNNYILLLLY